jgi:glutamate-1-semialdehyde 2,1-aminomutase
VSRAPTVDHALVRELKDAEDARFHAERPRSAELWARAWKVMPNGVPMSWHRGSYHHAPLWIAEGRGARFSDVDGFTYSDFNIADMSMFCGYAPEPVVRAVSDRMARGNQFLLPTEDAIVVAEELTRRYALPMWQFMLSASQANTEAIRVARVATGRDKVLLFDGKYHGHFDEALVELAPDGSLRAEERGLPIGGEAHTVVVPFNDPGAPADALAGGGIALVLTEPALTNNFGLIVPDDGFHAELRRLTRSTGTLLALDETHTQVVGPGGLTAAWGLEPDLVTAGKSIAAGVPFGRGRERDDRTRLAPDERPRRRARRHGRDRRHPVRQRALDGGGARHDARGPHGRGLREHREAGREARERHGHDRSGCRTPLAHPPSRSPGRLHVPSRTGHERGRGTRVRR